MFLRPLSLFRWHKNIGAAVVLVLAAGPAGLAAEPLDKDACSKLQAEKQALIVLGVDKEFAKGADWAKANLAQAELNLVKRYLTIDEQLKFRCGLAVVNLQVQDEAEDGPDEDGPAAPVGHSKVPMPERRDQSAAVKPAAKPAVAPAKAQQPAAAKPVTPAKTTPKPSSKAQSSWNTEMAPIESQSPALVDQLHAKPRHRPLENGDGG